MSPTNAISDDDIIAATRTWLEKAVIGLGLCPFADSVYRRGVVRFHVSHAASAEALLDELRAELSRLHREDAQRCETTLLVHPWALHDFTEFNEFLSICDEVVFDLGLEGELQVASFHPQYQFAGTEASDVENCTNRSPYPILHLLREASVERALESIDDPEAIYLTNIDRLRSLGHAGWQALWIK